MWQQNLGIEVELVNQDWKVYLSREMVGDFQVSRAGWIGDYEDPNTFLDLMRPNRGNNKTGWENMEYDSIMREANATINQEETLTTVLFVVDLGPDCYKDPNKFPTGPWCKKGDFILIRPYTGSRLIIHGREFRIINDDNVEGVVDDPRGIKRK